MKHLTGDMRFTAERMKVTCPPLEPAGKFDLALINELFARHPKLTQSNLQDLAKPFLQKADSNNIFPKLPSQLKSYHSKYRRRRRIL